MRQVFDLPNTPIAGGITVIEASAGTGKTYCLTGLVLRLLLEGRVSDVGRVLVVTFTNAAADELTTRLRSALRQAYRLLAGEDDEDRAGGDPFLRHLRDRYSDGDGATILRRALLHFDDLGVFTIHSFCKRVLEESAFESGIPFQPEFIDNDEPLLLRAAQDFWRRRFYRGDELLAAVAASQGWTPETFLDCYRTWRRHPGTRILPPAPDMDVAAAGLATAAAGLAKVFERTALRTFLASLRYRKKAPVDGDRLEPLLDGVAAFCCRSDAPGSAQARGLWAVLELTGERLRKTVLKAHHDAVGRHPFVAACDRLKAAIGDFEHSLRAAFVAEVDEIFEQAKRSTGTLAFDDLLRRVHAALSEPRRGPALAAVVRRQFHAALIDEFQDTDLVQYEIFRRLFKSGPLFLIGDPKQAIYRFRGADVFAYMAAKADAGRPYTLDRNWRSDPALLEALNALFGRVPRAFVFPGIPFEPVAAAAERGDELAAGVPLRTRLAGDDRRPLQWLWLPKVESKDKAGRSIRRAVSAEAVRLLDAGLKIHSEDGERDLEPADIAILVRTNNQARAFQESLRRAGIPAVVSRSGDIFASEEMAELQTLLAAIAEPADAGRLRAAWATRLWGDDAAAMHRKNGDDEAWQECLEELGDYRRQWLVWGFRPMVQHLINRRRVRRRLLAGSGGERRLTNLLHAAEVLHQAIVERHLSPAGILTWLDGERSPGRVHDSEATELRLESDAQAVQIATVHKSKGLEYGIVFCPYLWEARSEERPPVIAHLDARRLVYDFGSEAFAEHQAAAEAERLAEDLRLAYVAMTRARHRCYVVWGEVGRGAAASALGYLLRRVRGGADSGNPWADELTRSASSGSQLPLAAALAPRESTGDSVRRVLDEVRSDAGGWRGVLQELVDSHGEVMDLRPVDPDRGNGAAAHDPGEAIWCDGSAPPRELAGPTLPGDLDERLQPWRMASFTSLARRPGRRGSEIPDTLDPATPAPLRPAPGALPRPAGILAFARGPQAGTCLHEILEQCDFTAVASPESAQLIAGVLRRHGLDEPSRHGGNREVAQGFEPAAAVAEMLRWVAAAPLPGAGFALAEVPRERCLSEWHFFTPLKDLTPRDLAGVFRRHGRGRVRGDYAGHLENLDGSSVHGFLTGFVDLIFTHGDRWWVVDWKSNHLGDALQDYGVEGMWQSMRHHHYVLQYHLYVMALQRFLRLRLPDYDYDRHFGGVIYVFLRGVGGEPGSSEADGATGFFVDRPPRALVDALEESIDPL